MPFSRPTFSDLRAQGIQAILSSPLGLAGVLRFDPLRILSDIVAAMSHGHYGFIDWVAKQSVPFTAVAEYLEAWAALPGITRKQPSAATGSRIVTGTPATAIPLGSTFSRPDGATFTSTAAVIIPAGGTVTVPLIAAIPGIIGNDDGTGAISLAPGILGALALTTANGPLVGGTDLEGDFSLRGRMLERYAAPPEGGSQDDYLRWAKTVPGVTRAWVARNGYGAGTVVVYIMFDDIETAFSGIPQGRSGVATLEPRDVAATGDQLLVANYIYALQPVTALVYAVAPIADLVAFTVSNITAADPVTARALLPAAFAAVFRAKASPGGTIEPNEFYAAAQAVLGTSDFTIVAPAAPITAATGHIHVLGPITFA
ncbi:MAG: baseplate J/gp47 family protein [Bradyrhizobium sp.]